MDSRTRLVQLPVALLRECRIASGIDVLGDVDLHGQPPTLSHKEVVEARVR